MENQTYLAIFLDCLFSVACNLHLAFHISCHCFKTSLSTHQVHLGIPQSLYKQHPRQGFLTVIPDFNINSLIKLGAC